MASIVQFENVGLRYGKSPETLSDVSLDLDRGSFHFLTGPSGAGKSSLIALMHLAMRPSRGLIRLFGEAASPTDRGRAARLRRRTGMVFQQARLLPELTVAENVALPLRIAGEDEVRQPVTEMLDWLGLGHRSDAMPETLSGGERQCVAVARAVVHRPELLLADEPTGDLDADSAYRLLGLFDALNGMGTTVVLATHDLSLLDRIPRAGVLQLAGGRLVGE
ncbi:cell division ATP-binding protein FtsE [Sphingomonas sp. ID0503]|uniref:cell division ATP-binding protein FtsE n=1 Tax=Sphingomonas sp. ID0503 TaxID=3399691 RepID=UPI003AFB67B8